MNLWAQMSWRRDEEMVKSMSGMVMPGIPEVTPTETSAIGVAAASRRAAWDVDGVSSSPGLDSAEVAGNRRALDAQAAEGVVR